MDRVRSSDLHALLGLCACLPRHAVAGEPRNLINFGDSPNCLAYLLDDHASVLRNYDGGAAATSSKTTGSVTSGISSEGTIS